ncbi:hypothetical protein KL86DYS1_11757 [uncultured Dysgonomonas sp.]|uniref:Uncharacterized protein n=1 Tax=uncultured Dysgonomonas sp. TaxID=206096 RepID=A0A212JBS8_9BACT|nr:hypothetical protein KL86DYS1_11757 [uncultured Dysgonomonas sp.]
MNQKPDSSFFFTSSIRAFAGYRKENATCSNLTTPDSTLSFRGYPTGFGVYSLQEMNTQQMIKNNVVCFPIYALCKKSSLA